MKKLGILVIMALITATVFAQGLDNWTVGGRAGFGLGFNKPGAEFRNAMDDAEEAAKELDGSFDKKVTPGFILAAYGTYAFTPQFSIQPELNFIFGQGIKYESSFMGLSAETKITYKALDIPVLAKYTFIQSPVIVGALAGPYLSIPLGDFTQKVETNFPGAKDEKDNIAINGIGFGIALGGYAGYPLGPGRIVGDVRFIFDFTTLEMEVGNETLDVVARRALFFTVGYEISLNSIFK